MDIRALYRQGLTYAEIGRLVGRDWRTVKRYLTEGAQPVYRRKRAPSKLDPLKPVIDQWLAGCPRLLATPPTEPLTTSSCSVFQAPHWAHLPAQLRLIDPQLAQIYLTLSFAIVLL